ncbi:MAG TPA: phage tail tape measure protein, partial [Streptosporangiaceae bacterium]|nr:phage tail tape measure protein [Streptosporangiaceae bacterium]
MGSIVTTIDVGVTGAGAVEGLAEALKQADTAAASLQDSLRGGLGLEGLGKTAGAVDSFVTSLKAATKEISSSLAGIRKATEDAAAGIKGAADAAKGLADADKAVADSAKAAADSQKSLADGSAMAGRNMTGAADAGKALADAGKAVADASPAAAGGIKDVAAASADQARAARDAAAWMAETNKITRDFGLTSAEMAAVVNRSQLGVAKSQKALTDVQVTASREAAKAQRAAAAETEASAGRAHNVVLGVAGALGYGIYKAAQFQTQITRLYTSAGESKPNLPMISQGILGMAGPTATSQTDLVHGMYWVESGGFHGQTALNVLRSVAQGAYAEGAPLQDVANAATSILTSYGMYHPTQKQANSVVNQMLTAVGSGKMTMAGLSTALPSVLPVAASAGISLPQVLGTLATMTATGMSPEWASTNLSHTIGKLQNPTAVMTAEMYQLGLDPVAISQQLGKRQISGTFGEIQSAIKAHTNKAGEVVLPAMNISKSAQQDALMMMRQMPGAIRQVAEAYYDGHMSQAAWNKELFKGTESGQMGILLKQFGTLTALAHGYNSALKAGQPDVQAYSAAVTKTLGDSVAMRTFLMTTGTHAQVASQTIGGVAQAAKDAGVDVQGWPDIQKTFGYQLKSFEASATAAATTAGTALLPAATDVMSGLAKAGTFLSQHKKLTVDLAIAGGGLALVEAGKKLASPLKTLLGGIGKIGETLKIPGLDKLAGIGKGADLGGAAIKLDTAGASLSSAASALSGAAEKLGATGNTGLPGAKKPGEEKPPVPAPADEPGLIRRIVTSAPMARTVPLVITAGLSEIGKHAYPADYHRQLSYLQKINKPSDSYPGIGPLKKFTDSWAEPLLSGLGALGEGIWGGTEGFRHNTAANFDQARHGIASFFGNFAGGDFTRSRLAAMGVGPADNQQMIGDLARYKAQYAGHITLPVKLQPEGDAGLAGISSKLRSLTNLSAPKVNMSGVTTSVQAGMSSAAAAARSGSGQVTSAVAEIGAKVRSVTASFAGGMASAG